MIDQAQGEHGLGVLGADVQRGLVLRLGRGQAPGPLVDEAESEASLRVGGLQVQEALEEPAGLLALPPALELQGQVVERVRVLRGEIEDASVDGDLFLVPPALAEARRELVEGVGIIGGEGRGLLEGPVGQVPLVHPLIGRAEVEPALGAGISLAGAGEHRGRLVRLTVPEVEGAEHEAPPRVLGGLLHQPLIQRDGLVEAIQLLVGLGQEVAGLLDVGAQLHRGPQVHHRLPGLVALQVEQTQVVSGLEEVRRHP